MESLNGLLKVQRMVASGFLGLLQKYRNNCVTVFIDFVGRISINAGGSVLLDIR